MKGGAAARGKRDIIASCQENPESVWGSCGCSWVLGKEAF